MKEKLLEAILKVFTLDSRQQGEGIIEMATE